MKELWFKRDVSTQGLTVRDKLKIQLWRCVDALFFKTSLKALSVWRVFLLRLFGAKIGKGCYVSPKCTVTMPWNLVMGNFVSMDDYVFIKSSVRVSIGDYVSLSVFVHIVPGGHDVRARSFAYRGVPVAIGNGAFIGADAYIGRGVTIGQMAVVGARSLVLKDIPENSIAYGSPCVARAERIPDGVYKAYRYDYAE